MPDFSARITSGVTLATWDDPARPAGTQSLTDPGAPSRLNPRPEQPHRRHIATVGVPVVVQATVGGVEGPLDSALGGRLFRAWFVEAPGSSVQAPTGAAAQSSVQTFTPLYEGHYTLGIERDEGGALFIPVDAEA